LPTLKANAKKPKELFFGNTQLKIQEEKLILQIEIKRQKY